MAETDFLILLLAFAGGVIGASFGGLNVFVLCGLSAIIGTVYYLITGDYSFNANVTWGPLLGPHVTFAGALAATAYSAKNGLITDGKAVGMALFGLNKPMVLLIAGVFGVLGQLLLWGLELLPKIEGLSTVNEISLVLVIIGIIVRLIWSNTGLLGQLLPGQSRWRQEPTDEWTPWSMPFVQLLIASICFGLVASYINHEIPGSITLVFGISAFSLLFFQFGARIPVTHHIVLAAEYGTTVTGDIAWGVAAGVGAAIIGEIGARLFLNHGDTHIDPPALALTIMYSIVALLAWW